MDGLRDSSSQHATRLRDGLDDLSDLVALPGLRTPGEPDQIAGALLEALLGPLRLAFAMVRVSDPEGGPPIEVIRVAEAVEGAAQSGFSFASARLGPQGEIGLVVAGSQNPDFPTKTEKLVLDVAANQAVIGFQQALARVERRRTEAARRDSEAESRLVVDNIPGLVGILSASGAVQFVNRQILDYTGRTLEELAEWGTNDTVHPDDLPHVIQVFSQSIVSGTPYEIVQRLRRSDGAYRWFLNNGFPLRDTAGRIVRWCVLLTDIHERKCAEDALRESERASRLTVDCIPGLVATHTPDGQVEFVNQQLLEYFGLTLEELKHWDSSEITHPEDLPRVVKLFTHSIASGDPFDFEVRSRRADGVYRWLQSRGSPLRDSNGRIVRWYNLLIDIDERKRAEQALATNERGLKLITDTIPALAWSARPDGSADFFNQHYLEFVGLSAEQADGWGWTAAVHADDVNDLAATWQRILASGTTGEAEARLRRHDGEYRWFLFRANPLRDDTGAIVKWYGVNTDVDDLKRAEVGLRRSEAFLAEGQRLARIGNFVWHLGTGDVSWSDEVYRMFEFELGTKVTLKLISSRVHPEDLHMLNDLVERAGRGESYFEYEHRLLMPDDSIKHLHLIAHAARDAQGGLEYIGAVQDVTRRRAAEEALDRARSDLAHVARVATVSTLTASIAHEVNQPLSGIITNAGTCLRMLDATPPNIDGARETARRAIRDGNRAADVVARLRALYSKKEFTLEPLDLNDATREVIALSSTDLQRNRIAVQSEFADDLPSVTGDRIQLQQVILNLLRNASDAMAGVVDRPRQLLVRTEAESGERVRLTIRDAGIGLPAEGLDSLFDVFYTTKSGGMGIGLFVSRSIVERHQGRLWAEQNERGPGATFSFSIPVRMLLSDDDRRNPDAGPATRRRHRSVSRDQ